MSKVVFTCGHEHEALPGEVVSSDCKVKSCCGKILRIERPVNPKAAMTYTIKHHPGGYDIYRDGEPLSAQEVVRLLEQLTQSGHKDT